jgi:hypothetical protein
MVNEGITGKTYGVEIDPVTGYVNIAGEPFTRDSRETYIFNLAYKMGRDHKKKQIREALGI